MGAKQEKDSMITNNASGRYKAFRSMLSVVLSGILLGFNSCTPELSDDQIPYQAFPDIHINLNLPSYNSLRTVGGYAYVNDGGNRGILLYHQSQSVFIAYDRNCSYQPNNACATVGMHISTLYMIDDCCGSTFDLATGQPTGGVAWRPLRKYETILSSSTLTITSNIAE
jgi:hypothetical protein